MHCNIFSSKREGDKEKQCFSYETEKLSHTIQMNNMVTECYVLVLLNETTQLPSLG